MQSRNLARRFILLLDELYNARTRFFCTAACPPGDLFAGTSDDQPVVDLDQLEQLQFESAAEGDTSINSILQAFDYACAEIQYVPHADLSFLFEEYDLF